MKVGCVGRGNGMVLMDKKPVSPNRPRELVYRPIVSGKDDDVLNEVC